MESHGERERFPHYMIIYNYVNGMRIKKQSENELLNVTGKHENISCHKFPTFQVFVRLYHSPYDVISVCRIYDVKINISQE